MSETDRTYAVDRIEGRGKSARVILIDDLEETVELARSVLGRNAVEGAVLRVPVRAGKACWVEARRDRNEEARRLDEAAELMLKLRARDPGGDLVL